MKTTWFHILASLADDDLHGLGIVRNVLDQTGGALQLWPATLYNSLEDLVGSGMIRELREDEVPTGVSAQRRYYRLTDQGRTALRAEAERLRGLASVVLERLGRVPSR